jgi:4-amino-4-deoxy-L-arabinose transferase-like glycosyltransferase
MTAGTRSAWLLLVLGAATAVRLVNLQWMSEQPITEYQTLLTDGDMFNHWTWAGRILAGDLLGRDVFHPITPWMQSIAPQADWERWWGGPHVFDKAPLYPYLLALVRLTAGDSYWATGLCQLALGVVNVWLMFRLAERLFGSAVGVLAGLGGALYGPFLLHETLLLRDSLGVTVSLTLLLGLSRCDGAGTGRWIVAGILFGVALLARELTILFAPFVALWIVQRFRGQWPDAARACACFAAGMLLGLSPLVARNLTVGAPPFALAARATETFVLGHAAGSLPAGFGLPTTAGSILRASDGRLGPALRLTLDSYHGDWKQLARHEGARLGAIFAAHEGSDNVNWYYFADRSALLHFSLRYHVVLALGLVGVWLARRERRSDDRFLLYFLAVALLGLQYAVVVGRYRLVPAAILALYGGVTVHWLARAMSGRRWRDALAVAAAVLCIAFVSAHLLGEFAARERYRAAEFLYAAQTYLHRQQPDRAWHELRDGLEHAYGGPDQRRLPPGYPALVSWLLGLARQTGRNAEAAAVLQKLTLQYDADPYLPKLLEQVRQ